MLAKSIVMQCFANMVREHGCSVHTTRVHGYHFWRPMKTGHRDRQALLLMTS